ncbi:hypothetical protein ABVV53_07700 [Novosphingobium sp. RD2P27]|uniref:Uncharacterized protein n=1 Tax=Novosphingobium kalidii TaxID=3230299 RepID=A0ABV2D0D9_9SPHN
MPQNGSESGSPKQNNRSPAEPVTEDVGGVQGTAPDAGSESDASTALGPGAPDDEPAPDAGEIEWAGQVVKKPPTPER